MDQRQNLRLALINQALVDAQGYETPEVFSQNELERLRELACLGISYQIFKLLGGSTFAEVAP